jgi:primosomal protein N'
MFAQIIVDIAHSDVDRLFTYAVPEGMALAVGQRVLVPFGRGNKPQEGFVLSLSEYPPEEGVRIKPVSRVLEPYPALTTEQIELARWMQQSYHCVLVDALRLMIPAQLRGRIQEKRLRLVRLAEELEPQAALASLRKRDGSAKAPRQLEVLELLLRMGGPKSVQDITGFLPDAGGAITALIKKGILEEDACVTFRRPSGGCGQEAPLLALTSEQQTAVDTNRAGDLCAVFLLHCVTGSGKTKSTCADQPCIEGGIQGDRSGAGYLSHSQTMCLFSARFGERVGHAAQPPFGGRALRRMAAHTPGAGAGRGGARSAGSPRLKTGPHRSRRRSDKVPERAFPALSRGGGREKALRHG